MSAYLQPGRRINRYLEYCEYYLGAQIISLRDANVEEHALLSPLPYKFVHLYLITINTFYLIKSCPTQATYMIFNSAHMHFDRYSTGLHITVCARFYLILFYFFNR